MRPEVEQKGVKPGAEPHGAEHAQPHPPPAPQQVGLHPVQVLLVRPLRPVDHGRRHPGQQEEGQADLVLQQGADGLHDLVAELADGVLDGGERFPPQDDGLALLLELGAARLGDGALARGLG